jgi:hypothetical protein
MVAAFTGAATMATLAMIAIDWRIKFRMVFFMSGSPCWRASEQELAWGQASRRILRRSGMMPQER